MVKPPCTSICNPRDYGTINQFELCHVSIADKIKLHGQVEVACASSGMGLTLPIIFRTKLLASVKSGTTLESVILSRTAVHISLASLNWVDGAHNGVALKDLGVKVRDGVVNLSTQLCWSSL